MNHDEDCYDLATELWAIAQTPPGGLVEDSIERIYLMLKEFKYSLLDEDSNT